MKERRNQAARQEVAASSLATWTLADARSRSTLPPEDQCCISSQWCLATCLQRGNPPELTPSFWADIRVVRHETEACYSNRDHSSKAPHSNRGNEEMQRDKHCPLDYSRETKSTLHDVEEKQIDACNAKSLAEIRQNKTRPSDQW